MLDIPPSQATIGFIGLGEMGLPMASNLLEDGFDILGYDVDRTALDELSSRGGTVAEAVAEIGTTCPIALIAVRDDEQVTEILTREDGLFENAALNESPCLVIVHSTINPVTCEDLSAVAPENVTLVDAPVSGMRVDAETGDLSIITGGPEDAIAYCRPLFESIGDSIHKMGEVGAGELGKLTNNLISLSNIMITAEGLRVGRTFGIDEESLLQLFAQSTADSWIVENWDFISSRWGETHPGGYEAAARLVGKDYDLILDLAEALEEPVPGTGVASQQVPAFLRELSNR